MGTVERKERRRANWASRLDPVWQLADMMEDLRISDLEPKKTKKGLSVRFAEPVVTRVEVVERAERKLGKFKRRAKRDALVSSLFHSFVVVLWPSPWFFRMYLLVAGWFPFQLARMVVVVSFEHIKVRSFPTLS